MPLSRLLFVLARPAIRAPHSVLCDEIIVLIRNFVNTHYRRSIHRGMPTCLSSLMSHDQPHRRSQPQRRSNISPLDTVSAPTDILVSPPVTQRLFRNQGRNVHPFPGGPEPRLPNSVPSIPIDIRNRADLGTIPASLRSVLYYLLFLDDPKLSGPWRFSPSLNFPRGSHSQRFTLSCFSIRHLSAA